MMREKESVQDGRFMIHFGRKEEEEAESYSFQWKMKWISSLTSFNDFLVYHMYQERNRQAEVVLSSGRSISYSYGRTKNKQNERGR